MEIPAQMHQLTTRFSLEVSASFLDTHVKCVVMCIIDMTRRVPCVEQQSCASPPCQIAWIVHVCGLCISAVICYAESFLANMISACEAVASSRVSHRNSAHVHWHPEGNTACLYIEGKGCRTSQHTVKARHTTREGWCVTSVVIALPLVLQKEPLCRL